MADAPEIKVKLTAEDTGVSAAIKELTSQLKTLKKQQDQTAGSGLSLARAFQGIAAAGLLLGLGKIGKDAFDAAAGIARASQVTGASVQTLTVFHKAAGDLGISTEAVDKGFVKLSRSILEFQQGGALVAKAFQALNISQKDLAGLNTDQKILLITNRLGAMKDSTTKAALAQQLLGRSGAQLIPVLNDLAGEGFENARAKAERFGLLLDNETQASLLAAKKSFQDLEDAGKGMATQFEAGIVPALTDVANALVKATTDKGVSGFKSLGEAAGSAMKGMLIGIVAVVAGLIEIGAKTSALMQNIGRAIADALTKGPKEAWKQFQQNELGDAARIDAEIQSRETALLSELQGNTRQQDVVDAKAKAGRRSQNAPPAITSLAPSDAAARAALVLLMKQMEDELAIHRAYAKQSEQIDKERFDKGELSLKEYFDRRRAEVTADARDEVAILKHGVDAANAEAQKAALAKQKAETPKDADKQEAARLQALTKVEELQTKIRETEINSATKIEALNTEEFAKSDAHQQKVLEFQKEIAALQGNRQGVTKAEIAQEAEKLRREQVGTEEQIAQFTELKTAQAEFADAETKLQQDRRSFDIEKQRIEIEAKTRKISQLEAEKELNALIAERLPLLRADAQAELSAAKKTGNQDNVAAAQNAVAGVENVKASATSLGQTLRGSISADFGNFFENLGRSTASAADQFRSLAASVVASLEQILVKLLLVKIFGGGAEGGGGGLLGGLFGLGHAEGGLITGPGGPKSDSIPARVSPGEYIVKADAVSAFGVANLEAINRGLKIPSLERLALPKFAEGGLVGNAGGGGASNINLGIGLDEGLILKHLSSKAAGNIVLQHLTNNPKAASKALSRAE
ncbi:MAG: hypothetical protein LAN84_00235 [Acidobacteriia bacterium]|nr:hypothetical protein [Terriglobia bacterium]